MRITDWDRGAPVGGARVGIGIRGLARTRLFRAMEFFIAHSAGDFIRPGALPIFFNVQIANTPGLPSNIVTLVQNAIIAQFNGQNGNARARIGSTILAAQYYAPVSGIGPFVTLLSIQIGTSGPGSSTEVPVGIDQTPIISSGNITVTLV